MVNKNDDEETVLIKSSVSTFLYNLVWTGFSLFIIHYINLISIISSLEPTLSFYLAISSVFGISLVFLYITFYLPLKTGSRIDLKNWEKTVPRSIQFATVCGVVSFISCNFLLWAHFSFLSPVVLLILLFGGISFVGLFSVFF